MLLRLLTNAQQGTLNRISVAKNSIKRVLYTITTPISEVLQYRQHISHLVYFYPIFPLHRGGGIFDFMGAGPRNKEYGVRKFKLTFGGELTPEYRYRKYLIKKG